MLNLNMSRRNSKYFFTNIYIHNDEIMSPTSKRHCFDIVRLMRKNIYIVNDQNELVVVVRIFNATRHPRHIEAAAIVMYMYLYSLAFMDHPCTHGAAVCHQAPPCPLYTQPRARRELDVLMVWKLSRPERDSNPRYPAWKSNALTTRPPSPPEWTHWTISVFCLKFYKRKKKKKKKTKNKENKGDVWS